MAGFFALVRTSRTGAKSSVTPTASSSAAIALAKRAASAASLARPSVIIGGQRVNGSFSRWTRPPSWSTLNQSGVSLRSDSAGERELGHLRRRLDVAREDDQPAEVELARDLAHLRRQGQPVEAADQQLADVGTDVSQRHAW